MAAFGNNKPSYIDFPLIGAKAASPLAENSSPLVKNIDLEGFGEYLKAAKKRNTKQQVLYAAKYGYILYTQDAHEILTVSDTKRHHIMEALAGLSKYLGCYNRWKEVKERYQLKWSGSNSVEVFHSMFDSKENYSTMLAWLKDTCSKIPQSYANVLIYDTLTGLRPDEACQSINLIQTSLDNYLDKERSILEHFRYASIFIRNSKKAFISMVDDQILQVAKDAKNCGYDALRSFLRRRSLDMNMGYCRKIHGTFLRMHGIESELVDLIQGRVPRTVFGRHYLRPDFEKEQERIMECVVKLEREITS